MGGFRPQTRIPELTSPPAPASLAEAIVDRIEEARERYAPPLEFDTPSELFDLSRQPGLPFHLRPARQTVAGSGG